MQGWRTLAEVAKELGVTARTLQRRLAEAGIRPARPGRTAMLSDPDVTKLMEESRGRSKSSSEPLPEPRSPDEEPRQRQERTELLTDIRQSGAFSTALADGWVSFRLRRPRGARWAYPLCEIRAKRIARCDVNGTAGDLFDDRWRTFTPEVCHTPPGSIWTAPLATHST